MGLWESQGKTWKMFITTVNRNPDAHSVCCCSVYKVLSYMMKSDKLLLTQWGFHRWFIGQKERRERTGPVSETCHISCLCFLRSEHWSHKEVDPMPEWVRLLQRLSPVVMKCSLQRFRMSLRDSNLPWTAHHKKFIYTTLFIG